MRTLEKFFSVKNETIGKNSHKVLTILGIKIKFKFSKDDKNIALAQKRYTKVLKRIKDKIKNNKKIKVVFLIREKEKWSYESLYKEFERSNIFEPLIVLSCLKGGMQSNRDEVLLENHSFFKALNYNVEYGYKNGEFIDLSYFKPDVVFYDQPWGIDIYELLNVSDYALTMYCPYGYQTFSFKENYMKFHKFLYKYFVEHELNIKRFESYKKGNSKNCVAFGYPKLDVYLKNNETDVSKYWKIPDKYKIIYAPHFSFYKNSAVNIGTFLENKDFILNFAKTHPETTWIYKPHPRLEYTLVEEQKVMTKEEYELYKNEWAKVGNICKNGDYFDMFKSSDLMITDCASFLTEYLPSKHPLIRLKRSDAIAMNELGEKISSEYYNVWNNKELEETINMLILGNDPKKEAREKLSWLIIDYNESAASKIYKYLLKEFGVKND